MKRYLLLLAVFCIMSSCNRVMVAWYGIKQPRPLTDEQVVRYAIKYGAGTQYLYRFDTTFAHVWKHSPVLEEKDGKKMKERHKKLNQPLQYWVFDKNGDYVKYTANCYGTPGFTGMRFRDGFDKFPPVADSPDDSLVTLSFFVPYLQPVHAVPNTTTAGYTCIITWSRFMGRNSRRFLKAVNRSLQQAQPHKLNVYYVNNDAVFAGKIAR